LSRWISAGEPETLCPIGEDMLHHHGGFVRHFQHDLLAMASE